MIKFLRQLGDLFDFLAKAVRKWEQEALRRAIERGGSDAEEEVNSQSSGRPSRYSGDDGVFTVDEKEAD